MTGYFIATDEAGYGPHLGPLVIVATLWKTSRKPDAERLSRTIHEALGTWRAAGEPTLAIADSKSLFQSRSGIGTLEPTVLSALAHAARPFQVPCGWRDLCRAIDARTSDPPWHVAVSTDVPLEPLPAPAASRSFWCHLREEQGTELLAVRGEAVFPQQWKAMLDRLEKKSTVLTHLTLQLVDRVITEIENVHERMSSASGEHRLPVAILCDKHGGRNHYQAFLVEQWADRLGGSWIRAEEEGRQRSRYRLALGGRDTRIEFRAKADQCLPVALASMVAKYVREVSMAAFNAFWRQHCPGLRPTAGYPVDARRFAREVDATRRRLGIADHLFWRRK